MFISGYTEVVQGILPFAFYSAIIASSYSVLIKFRFYSKWVTLPFIVVIAGRIFERFVLSKSIKLTHLHHIQRYLIYKKRSEGWNHILLTFSLMPGNIKI